jgi:hypothetical protein
LFQRHEPIAGMSGNAAALTMSQAIPLRRADSVAEPHLGWRDRLAQLDLVPDLGDNIGSAIWWRGLGDINPALRDSDRDLPRYPAARNRWNAPRSTLRISTKRAHR